MRLRPLSTAILAAALLASRTAGATTVVGDLNNFDTVNDTGQTTYGFEIEIDDVRSTDITYTFDWNHYGVPKIAEDTTDPLHPKVLVRYESTKDAGGALGANGSYTNQAVPSLTPPQGHDCTNVAVNEGCEHFGVGYYGTPSNIVYRWLVDDGTGNLVPFGSTVKVGTPNWTYQPPAAGQPAQVVAAMPAPPDAIPAGKEYGEAVWMKVIKTTSHSVNQVALENLISDDADDDGKAEWQNGEPDEVETEWKLLQTNTKGDAAKDGLDGAPDDVGDVDENVTRRYEFYKYGAAADTFDGETGEAMCDEVDPTIDPLDPNYLHGIGTAVTVTDANGDSYEVNCAAQVVVGEFIGAQMAGFVAEAPLDVIPNLQDGEEDQPYVDRRVVVGGDTPYTVTVTDGALPDGMTLGDDGILTGTPATPGDYAFTVQVVDAKAAVVARPLALHVPGPVAPTPTPTPDPTATPAPTATPTPVPTATPLPPTPTPVVVSCSMGAGLAQTPPKPPKNSGTLRIARGLTATPSTSPTKFLFSGTLENCRNFPAVPGAVGPITNGAVKVTLQIPAGSTCAALTPGFPITTQLAITWTTPDPARPGKYKKVATEKTTLASYLEPTADPLVIRVTSQAFGVKSKVPGFATKNAVLTFAMDQDSAAIATACADARGLSLMSFTGAIAPSTLVVP